MAQGTDLRKADARVLRAAGGRNTTSNEITDGVCGIRPADARRIPSYDPWDEYVTVWATPSATAQEEGRTHRPPSAITHGSRRPTRSC